MLDFLYSSVRNRCRHTETPRYKEAELWEGFHLSQVRREQG